MKNRLYIFAVVLLCLFTLFEFYTFMGSVAGFMGGSDRARAVVSAKKTDAIVVLTGGQGRVETGLALLREGKSPQLIVSGVNSGSSYKGIFRNRLLKGEQFRIILEKNSKSTYENALEVKRLVEELNIGSITLITSSYHMKRAFTAFERFMPSGVKVVPYTISTPNFDEEHMWAPENIAVTLPEFIKYYWYEIRYNMNIDTV